MANTAARLSTSPSTWLDRLTPDAAALRARLATQHPGFRSGKPGQIAIVGAADEGVRLAEICAAIGTRVVAIVDDNPAKLGTTVGPLHVGKVDSLDALSRDVPVVIASHRVLKVLERLQAMGFQNVAPFALLQVLNPTDFPPHMFYTQLLEDLAAQRDKYAALASRLADDKSRRVLDCVLGFRQTLDARVLAPEIEWDLYGPTSLLSYRDDEVYVDGGTFDGDTIRLFIARVKDKFERVIGFEPDKNTFKRLAANFAHEPRVETINAGLHRRRDTLHFDNAGTRGSILVESGGIEVPVVGLDEVLAGRRVTYIKMNIEGAELEALHGAQNSIRTWAPKLAISAYHRPSDLWEVADVITAIRPEYKLYLRQHDGGVIETVLYALP
jgi:FkbM family methyltransferase